MHGPINVESPNNTSKWQMGFNSAFKRLNSKILLWLIKQINCLIFMDPCIVDDSVEIPIRCSFVIEFIIPKFIEGPTCFERHTAYHQEL